jgi:hypothetical protein
VVRTSDGDVVIPNSALIESVGAFATPARAAGCAGRA